MRKHRTSASSDFPLVAFAAWGSLHGAGHRTGGRVRRVQEAVAVPVERLLGFLVAQDARFTANLCRPGSGS